MSALLQIHVAPNRHALITSDGKPFVWLGDTAWELFHRLERGEAEQYMADRAAKGFSLLQIVALAEFDGIHTPNAYGHTPFVGDDPLQPNEPYWQYVDEMIALAAAHGLYIGLLPTWGDKLPTWGEGPVIFDQANIGAYGKWLATRYARHSNIVWILGGDRPAVYESGQYANNRPSYDHRPLWRALAESIATVIPNALLTYHPPGGQGTSAYLHHEHWLASNMNQSGHGSGHDTPVWELIQHDYQLQPTKPTLDAEPNYEDHPVNPWPTWNPANGYFRDYDVRKQCYRSILAGACGVTYGHHAVWQFYDPAKREPINYADRPWQQALDRPGAQHMRHLRDLFERFPIIDLVPDQSLLASPEGTGGNHIRAARAASGSHALLYLPETAPVVLHLGWLHDAPARASWFNPRTGATTAIGRITPTEVHRFTPPEDGPDWLLVVER